MKGMGKGGGVVRCLFSKNSIPLQAVKCSKLREKFLLKLTKFPCQNVGAGEREIPLSYFTVVYKRTVRNEVFVLVNSYHIWPIPLTLELHS